MQTALTNMHSTYTFLRNAVLLLLLTGTLSACDENAVGPDEEQPDDINVPTAYAFESRFEEGASSVAYPGQIVRNLLIQDLKIMIDGLAKEGAEPVTESELLARYEYDDDNLPILTSTNPAPNAEVYEDITTGKDLVGKVTSQYGNQPLIGRGDTTANDLIRKYFGIIAQNAQDPSKLGTPAVYTTEKGVDLSQMINKLLLGAVVYSQGTGKYLDISLESENGEPADGAPFTVMEHTWDEAFGYFGTARDYSQYSDDDLASGNTYDDTDGDGSIDLSSEYNHTYATYAGKRDASGTDVNFTQEIFEAFLKGRTAIVNEASAQEIAQYRDQAAHAWERLVAANVVHYINSTLEDLEEVTQAQVEEKNNEELNEHWAEGKGFAYALQYNAFRQITDDQLGTLHTLLGDAPLYALPGSADSEAYREDLQEAKDLLQSVYGFSETNLQSW